MKVKRFNKTLHKNIDAIPRNIHVFTNEIQIVKILNPFFSIQKIFTENKNLIKLLKNSNHKIVLIKSSKDLPKKNHPTIKIGICCAFGLIFKKSFLDNYTFGIWNIHYGSLPDYRGRHPITAAFLKDEKKIGLSIHILDENIDRGYLLAKSYVKRNYNDYEHSIKQKLYSIILKVLKKSIQNFIKNKLVKVAKGNYYKPFYSGIKINNSKNTESKYILNAAKAQYDYDGIKVNKKKYSDAYFYTSKYLKKKNIEIITCKNNNKLILIKNCK